MGRTGCAFHRLAESWRCHWTLIHSPGSRKRTSVLLLADVIEREVGEAQVRGDLTTDRAASLMTFQLHAYVSEANWALQLFGDPAVLGAARTAIARLLVKAA